MLVLLILLAIATPLCALAGFLAALTALGRTRELSLAVQRLRVELSAIENRFAAPPSAAPTPAEVVQPTPAEAAPPAPAADAAPTPEPVRPPPLPIIVPTAPTPRDTEKTREMREAAARLRDAIERQIMERWAIWLGAVALALGGAFLVKYSIDNGLLGPGTRVVLGVCLGLALNLAGEFFHRRPPRAEIAATTLVPALVAAGMVTLFSSVYAAYGLYGFIGPATAFIALAAVSIATVALSLRHGPVIAAIGMSGALIVPAVVGSAEPAPWTLFSYLALVVVGCATLIRAMRWWWLGWLTLAGVGGWSLLWLANPPTTLGSLPFTAFLLVSATATFLLLHRPDDASPASRAMIWTAMGSMALLMLFNLIESGDASTARIGAAALIALYLYAGFRDPSFDRAPWIATAFAPLAIFFWSGWIAFVGQRIDPLHPPPIVAPIFTTAGIFAALIAGGGFWALWRAPRPQRWAAASAAAPVLLLATLYIRGADALSQTPWAMLGLALAALGTAAAFLVARERERPEMEQALAFYAAATIAAISLAATMSLERGWLTVALAIELPALAWIVERTGVKALRAVAAVIAGIVLLRLVFNLDLADASQGSGIVFNAILYVYGVSLATFVVAALRFRRTGDDALVAGLESAAIVAGFLLILLEIRHAFAPGRLLQEPISAGEVAVQLNAWLLATLLLFWLRARTARPVYMTASQIAAILAGLIIVAGPILGTDPLFSPEARVGDTPFFNLLIPLYGLPALWSLALCRAAGSAGEKELRASFGGASLLLVFIYISFNVRQLFQGGDLSHGVVGDAESYAYSAAWLCYGGALLIGGIFWTNRVVRYAGLSVLGLAIAKTFLYDMSALTGLYRAASFLGLGAALMGLGYLYQRFVRTADTP